MHHILNKKAVFFDLDGTLVDSAKDIHHALNLTLKQHQLHEVTDVQVRSWIGRGSKVLIEYAMAYQAKVADLKISKEFINNIHTDFLDIYENHVCIHTSIYDGVIPLLDTLKAQQITIVCITNKPEKPALKLLKKLALYDYFSLILGGDSLDKKKPDPLPLNHALKEFNLKASDAVMVGDSKFDVLAAHNAQMQSIGITYGYNHGEPLIDSNPTLIIDNFRELLDN